ncbi:MAG: hypothetical protein ACOYM2_07700 [Rectinemataceae bacterium]
MYAVLGTIGDNSFLNDLKKQNEGYMKTLEALSASWRAQPDKHWRKMYG